MSAVYRCVRSSASAIFRSYVGAVGEVVQHEPHPNWEVFLLVPGYGEVGFLRDELEPLTPEEESAWRLAGSSFDLAQGGVA